ncbi:hypothetical protein AB1Y20_017705 [Prymnesium parvum]|uniref:3-ketodihydrosphingosine reductase n=1 Tax=Prymnesium parvum TaxID=97485 RepID=A0AB34JMW5_PRYPA
MLSFIMSLEFLLCITLCSPAMYFVLNCLVPLILGEQNLKKKYKAQWAVVTGSSSGIGKELARKLLFQGLDVILIARDEPIFEDTVGELKALFPERQVLKVAANLSDESGKWMEGITKTVGDKKVQVIFLNAGYILTGMFESNTVGAQLANLHCNLTSNIYLCHFFYSRLLAAGDKGCIVFTSSSASYIPNPFAVMYGTTKAAVSAFAASLAVEARARGIHVHAIHPSPVNSRFSTGGGNQIKVTKIEAMDQFYKFASGPEALPTKFLRHIGRGAVVADIGGVSMMLRMVVHLLGYNLMAFATAVCAPFMPDYKKGIADSAKKS